MSRTPREILPAGDRLREVRLLSEFTKETDIMDVWFDSGRDPCSCSAT